MVTPWGNKLPGERNNARNNARCTQARKTTHGLGGQHQDVDRTPPCKSQSEWQRTGINGESTSMVWPTLGSMTAKEQNSSVTLYTRESLQVQTAHALLHCSWHYQHSHSNSRIEQLQSIVITGSYHHHIITELNWTNNKQKRRSLTLQQVDLSTRL